MLGFGVEQRGALRTGHAMVVPVAGLAEFGPES
jgi:hypothetical protein